MNTGMSPSPAIYRAPTVAPSFAPIGSGLRITFLVMVCASTLGFFGSVAIWCAGIIVNPEQPSETLMIAGGISLGATILVLYAQIAVGLFWVYRVWSWLPVDQRWSRQWKSWITPGAAAGMLLIPYFQYYWMFVIDCGICDAMDRLRVSHPTSRIAPKNLAITACICQMIVPLPVGAILWLMYMGRIEEMSREMARGSSAIAQTGMVRY